MSVRESSSLTSTGKALREIAFDLLNRIIDDVYDAVARGVPVQIERLEVIEGDNVFGFRLHYDCGGRLGYVDWTG